MQPPQWPPRRVPARGSVGAMGPDPDLELLVAWRAGDRRAGGELLRKHHPSIRKLVFMKVPEDSVEDIVQDVFDVLVKQRDSFRADALFKTYILRITRNCIANHYRINGPTPPADVLDTAVRDPDIGLITRLLAHEKQRQLLTALRSLSIDDQIILELHYWEHLTGPELCQVYECAEPNIRSRLRRARERLEDACRRITNGEDALADTLSDLDSWAHKLREGLQTYFEELKDRAASRSASPRDRSPAPR